MKLSNLKTWHIAALLILIIGVMPVLFTLPACRYYLNFRETGGIGDTLSGITAPFINAIAAILVFVAFKAQIEANNLIRSQSDTTIILDQINQIQNNFQLNDDQIEGLTNRIHSMRGNQNFIHLCNNVLHFVSDIFYITELIKDHSGKKRQLYLKMYYIYTIRYHGRLNALLQQIEQHKPLNNMYDSFIENIKRDINHCNSFFAGKDKYLKESE